MGPIRSVSFVTFHVVLVTFHVVVVEHRPTGAGRVPGGGLVGSGRDLLAGGVAVGRVPRARTQPAFVDLVRRPVLRATGDRLERSRIGSLLHGLSLSWGHPLT
ncbi:MAG: hypothetical protein M3N57_01400 [Actinomycetota bacterium]|nr:hypothetical protein [Actinomycetota bacterium]